MLHHFLNYLRRSSIPTETLRSVLSMEQLEALLKDYDIYSLAQKKHPARLPLRLRFH